MITDEVIRKASGQYDQELIQRLRLEGLGLQTISNLSSCKGLIELSLKCNEITEISGMSSLVSLRRLDLSHNRITRIENLGDLFNLEWLNLSANHITELSDMLELTSLENLRNLSFQGVGGADSNPLCKHPSYMAVIRRDLPALDVLDGGHLELIGFAEEMEQRFSDIQPIPETVTTPPAERWFATVNDLDQGASPESGTDGSDGVLNDNNPAYLSYLEAREMIEKEGADLLAEALNALNNAVTK